MIKMTCCFCKEEMKMENGAGHFCETTYYQPAKILTDEEIEIECRKAWNLHYQDKLNLEEVLIFARAILRKAQEK